MRLARLLLTGLVLGLSFGLGVAPATAGPIDYVINVSVDGLGSSYLQSLINANQLPNFKRFQTEGAWTNNARNDYDSTVTLPNHASMFTGRGVLGASGHNWTGNVDPLPGQTLHSNKGSYVASVFDVVHDNGLRTGMYVGKTKFSLFDTSYDATNGAPDITGPNNGRDKIDTYVFNGSSAALTSSFVTDMAANPYRYSFVHFADPDTVGHASGWGSTDYNNAVIAIDGYLASLFNLVSTNPTLQGRTAIVLSSDHGGNGTDHSNAADPLNFTIPFYVWGPTVTAGADLYALNPATRANPGAGRPNYSASPQPIRNGDVANLSLQLLGLGPVAGSTINAAQNLVVSGALGSAPTTIQLTGVYTQDFDFMGPTGTAAPPYWAVGPYSTLQNNVATPGSAVSNDALTVDDGNNGTVGLSFNYGTAGAADRAVGNAPTTASGDRGIQVGFTNKTGNPISILRIGYTGEEWRTNGGTSPQTFTLFLSPSASTGFTALPVFTFSSPTNTAAGPLDGNAAANRRSITGYYKFPTPLAPDQTFYLTWHDLNDSGVADHGLAVDDFSLQSFSKVLANSFFLEPAVGAASYTPGAAADELGFTTTFTQQGAPAAVVGVSASRFFHAQNAQTDTTFTPVDIAIYNDVVVSMHLNIMSTNYENDQDYFRATLTNGADTIDLVRLDGSVMDGLAGNWLFYSATVPNSWNTLTLRVTTFSNSSAGAEGYDFGNIVITGVVPEPSSLVLAVLAFGGLGLAGRSRRRPA